MLRWHKGKEFKKDKHKMKAVTSGDKEELKLAFTLKDLKLIFGRAHDAGNRL